MNPDIFNLNPLESEPDTCPFSELELNITKILIDIIKNNNSEKRGKIGLFIIKDFIIYIIYIEKQISL